MSILWVLYMHWIKRVGETLKHRCHINIREQVMMLMTMVAKRMSLTGLLMIDKSVRILIASSSSSSTHPSILDRCTSSRGRS